MPFGYCTLRLGDAEWHLVSVVGCNNRRALHRMDYKSSYDQRSVALLAYCFAAAAAAAASAAAFSLTAFNAAAFACWSASFFALRSATCF